VDIGGSLEHIAAQDMKSSVFESSLSPIAQQKKKGRG
jgi:hypothetical protein